MFKQGDAVWVPLYVAGERGDGVLMAANPHAAKAGRGSVFVMPAEVLPYCDALPAVARWLATHPDFATNLGFVLSKARDVLDGVGSERDILALYEAFDFKKALTGGEGAGGG